MIAVEVRLYREGLAHALARHGRLVVAGTVTSPAEILGPSGARDFDVILLDLSTPRSLEHARTLTASLPDVAIVGLAVDDVDRDMMAAAEAGVVGYVPRDSSLDDLVTAVEAAARGELRCSPRMAGALLRRVASLAGAPAAAITAREREVVELVDQGLSNKEIAVRLSIEVATVKNHIHSILEKLGARRRGEAAAIMRRRAVRPRRSGASRLE
jgi:DNA-binding NarL/FixJ family response regulator